MSARPAQHGAAASADERRRSATSAGDRGSRASSARSRRRGGSSRRSSGRGPAAGWRAPARKTRWPASSCQPGSICAPIACATPRMMPPASVPQRLPRPPMITASKPKIRRAGPIDGIEIGADRRGRRRRSRRRPATAPWRGRRCGRLSRPISRAISGVVGGGAEGAAERACGRRRTAARRSTSDRGGEHEERQHADVEAAADAECSRSRSRPALSRRLSAVKISSRPFWMMTERPKVTRSGGRMSLPSVRLRRPRCST